MDKMPSVPLPVTGHLQIKMHINDLLLDEGKMVLSM